MKASWIARWLLLAAMSVSCASAASSTEADRVVLRAVAHKTTTTEAAFAPHGPGWIEQELPLVPLDNVRLLKGLSLSAHWLRLEFDNEAANTVHRCLDLGRLSDTNVRVFTDEVGPAGNASWRELTEASSAMEEERRDLLCGAVTPGRAWPLELRSGKRLTVIVRVESLQGIKMNARLLLPTEARAASQTARDLAFVAVMAAVASALTMLLLALFGNSARNLLLGANALAGWVWISTLDTTVASRASMHLMQLIGPYGALVSGALFATTYLLSYNGFLNRERESAILERAGMWLSAAVLLSLPLVLVLRVSEVIWLQWLLIGVTPFLTLAYSWKAWKRHEPASIWLLCTHLSLLAIYAWQLHDLLAANTLTTLKPETQVVWLACLLLHNLARSRLHENSRIDRISPTSVAKLEAEVERRTEDLRIARENAERTGALQRDFLATMSHELRTPLASVVGLCRMLGDDKALPERVRQDMGTVERLAVHLLRMVDDGLAYVRQRGKEAPVTRKPVNMRILLRDMESVSRWLSQRQNNDFKMLQVRNVPPILHFDEQRLRQVLINLVSNAGLYCQDGQVSLGVAFKTTNNEPSLSWLIGDSGRGMSPEEIKKAFEPFTKSRDSQGLGLGLALVKKLTEEMGGSIRVQSQVGLGTQFYVSIPVSAEGADLEELPLEEDVTPRQDDAAVSRPMALLPDLDLGRLQLDGLRMHVRLGQLSEIEEWISGMDGASGLSAEADRFLRKVRQAAANVDLAAIGALIDQIDTPLDKT